MYIYNRSNYSILFPTKFYYCDMNHNSSIKCQVDEFFFFNFAVQANEYNKSSVRI